MGAAIFGAELRRPETAEAARIRHGGETSLLLAAVSAVQASVKAALQIAADQSGAITLTSFLQVLQDGDLLPLSAVIPDEVKKLQAAGKPAAATPGIPA